MGPVDQAFPVTAVLQGEAHRGAADAELAAPVVVLGVPAFHQGKVEAPGELEVGIRRGMGRLLGGWVLLAVVVEQVVEQLLHMPLLAALALAAALDEPGFVLPGIQHARAPCSASRRFSSRADRPMPAMWG
ncbi:hypothetical protein D3C85_1008590 [compost metagenome]